MAFLRVILLFKLVLTLNLRLVALKCILDVQDDFSLSNPPVLYYSSGGNEFDLAMPNMRTNVTSFIDVYGSKCSREGDSATLILACPGSRNSIEGKNRDSVEIACSCRQNELEVDADELKELKCKDSVKGNDELTSTSCNGGLGKIVSIGYSYRSKFTELIQACHKVSDGTTFYARHTLFGSHFPMKIKSKKGGSTRPSFHWTNRQLFKNFPPSKAYPFNKQLATLSSLVGSSEAKLILNRTADKYFSRGHLAPNADFMLNSWRPATFLYENVQPQWQKINKEGWRELESMLRKSAAKKGQNWEIITGVHDILKLPIGSPNEVPIYLGPKETLPVPKFFWKLVHNPETSECIGFVINNYPDPSLQLNECSEDCSRYDWIVKKMGNDGVLRCCSYEDLTSSIPEIPLDVPCSAVLKG